MLDEALYTQAQFSSLSEPLRRERHYKSMSFGNPPMLFGAQSTSNTFKDPWRMFRFWFESLVSLVDTNQTFMTWLETHIGDQYPQICLLLRKVRVRNTRAHTICCVL